MQRPYFGFMNAKENCNQSRQSDAEQAGRANGGPT